MCFWLYVWTFYVYCSSTLTPTFPQLSKLLNYLQFPRAKVAVFVVFFGVWRYDFLLHICLYLIADLCFL